MANEAHKWKKTALAVANGATVSSGFTLEAWTTFVALQFPAMDNGDITLEFSADGSTYVTVLDPSDGADLVIVASGEDPGWIDISDYIRAVPRGANDHFLRIVCAAQTSGAVTLYIYEGS